MTGGRWWDRQGREDRSRARRVLCLLLFGILAVVAVSLVKQPEFDLVSGADWRERAALAERAADAGRQLRSIRGASWGSRP